MIPEKLTTILGIVENSEKILETDEPLFNKKKKEALNSFLFQDNSETDIWKSASYEVDMHGKIITNKVDLENLKYHHNVKKVSYLRLPYQNINRLI